MSEAGWLAEGDRRIGVRVRRAILSDDASETVVGFADGTVVGWLPSHLSDFISEYTGKAAPLWHIKYDSQNMGEEDLEEVEVDDAAKAFSTEAWSNSEKSRQVREYREQLLHTLTQDTKPIASSAQTPTPPVSFRNASSLCSTRRKGSKFQVGERVECQFHDGVWYEAVVDELRADGSVLVTWDDDDARDRIKNISDLRKILPEELEERDGFDAHSVPNTSEKGRQRGIDRSIGLTEDKEKGMGRDNPTGCKHDGGSYSSSHSRIYNDAQKDILEAHFQVEKFIVKEIAQELASKIDRLQGGRAADWNCVNVWFMNRRKRDRICGGASCAESATAGVVKNVVGEIGGTQGTGKGGRQKLRARYLMQQQEGLETGVSKESTDADEALGPRSCSRKSTLKLPAEAIESQQEWPRDAEMGAEMGDDDDHGAHGLSGFMHKCWECRKGKYKGWKCSVRQCRSEVGSGVKGALGHTEPNWFDDEREKLLDESEKSAEMHSSKYAGSSSDKEQDSADETSRSKVNGEECGISDNDGNAVALRSARLCKQQSVEMQKALAREQARADAAVAERDRLATSNNRLKASLQTAEQKVARLLGHELGILTTAQLLNLQADHQEILGRVSGELLARECEAAVIAKHPEFVCPLSEEGHGGAKGGRALEVGPRGSRLMVDPVVAGDGHTYERANIETWFNQKGNVRSPKTGERLSTKEVMPNRLAKAGIIQALEDARKRKIEAQTAPASVAADIQSLPLRHQALALAGNFSAENTRGRAVRGVDANTRKREQELQSKHGEVEEDTGEKDAKNKKHQSSDSLCPHCGRSFLNVPSAQR